MKYLGVLLDSSLTFDDRTDYLTDKASKKLGAIRKISNVLDCSTTLTLVLAIFAYF